MGSELPTKVGEREEAVGIVEALLIFSVTAFDLAVVAGRVGANQLVADAQAGGGGLKERQVAAILDGEAIGEFRAVIGLNTLDLDAAAGIPGNCFLQEIGGGIGAMLLVSAQIAQASKFIYGGILEQLKAWVGDAAQGYDFHVDLYALARMHHLLVRFGNVLPLFLRRREHTNSV